MKRKTIVIVGAGPKALTIAAKAKALENAGWNTPKIIIVEKAEVGANWNGKNGYTNGEGVLGISPLKTVNYPSRSIYGDKVVKEMDNYSFLKYLAEKNRLEKWIDGGMQWITHKEFADYLEWVSLSFKATIRYGEVEKVRAKNGQWIITCKTNKLVADGLVFTGPGEVNNPFKVNPNGRFIYDGKNWWKNRKDFAAYNGKIALIGGGISAGSIFEFLMPMLGKEAKVDWYARRGIFTRSENFTNNQRFSNTNSWQQIPKGQRAAFIQSTDRGSIDSSTNEVMARYSENFSEVIGEINSLKILDWGVGVTYTDGLSEKFRQYDKVIISTGFCNTSFLELMDPATKTFFKGKRIESMIAPDLSVKGLSPTLHLPMLASLNVGIGCSILSSLGEMSDRLLSPWVSNPLSDSVNNLTRIGKHALKGKALFSTEGFAPGDIVTNGYPIYFSPVRTKTSVQTGIDMHMEPSRNFVSANHSCEPNCGIRLNEYGGYSLIAMDWISAGEEITWDYAMSEWESVALKKGMCRCGSKNCRGDVGGYKNLSKQIKEQYEGFTAPYLEFFV